MCNKESSLGIGEALNVTYREAERDVSLVVELAILKEVSDLLDVDTCTWHLPQSSMRWLTAGTRLAFITSFLQELAT